MASEIPSLYFPGLIDVVANHNGQPVFMYKENGNTLFADSYTYNNVKMIPPLPQQMLWSLVHRGHVETYQILGSEEQLFDELVSELHFVVELSREWDYLFLAAWIMTSYLWDHVEYFPILYVCSIPGRGKTRLGKFLTYTSYHGVMSLSLEEAHLIRLTQDYRATLYIDLSESSSITRNKKAYEFLLNRFEKGNRIPRITAASKGPFQDIRYYNTYGPTIITTNEPLNSVLESRTIELTLPETDRIFNNTITEEKCLNLREKLLGFRARYITEELCEVEKPIRGRLGDIIQPLIQVLDTASIQTEWLQDYVLLLEKERQASYADTPEGRVLQELVTIHERNKAMTVFNQEILEALRKDFPEYDRVKPESLGKILKKMGFQRYSNGCKRGVQWDEKLIRSLCQKYGIDYLPPIPERAALPQATNNPGVPKYYLS